MFFLICDLTGLTANDVSKTLYFNRIYICTFYNLHTNTFVLAYIYMYVSLNFRCCWVFFRCLGVFYFLILKALCKYPNESMISKKKTFKHFNKTQMHLKFDETCIKQLNADLYQLYQITLIHIGVSWPVYKLL